MRKGVSESCCDNPNPNRSSQCRGYRVVRCCCCAVGGEGGLGGVIGEGMW
jgi:hypothetical protein